MTAFRTLDQADVKGKRVLVRVDLNVPMENGKVTDATRIERVAPTITEIADKGGKVILLSHFGRPKGRDPKNSLKPVAAEVARIIKRPVAFADDCIGEAAEARGRRDEARRHPLPGEHALPRRRGKERSGLRRRARQARRHLRQRRLLGRAPRARLDRRPRRTCCRPMPAAPCRPSSTRSARRSSTPQRPVAAIVGGAKISTKLDLLGNLLAKVDALIIGGAMANTFLLAQGKTVGKSLCEHDLVDDRARDPGQGQGRQARDRAAGRRRGGAEIRGERAVARRSTSTRSATTT